MVWLMDYALSHMTAIGSRSENQDRVAYRENAHGVLLAIADGLGGYPNGEMAAETVIDCLLEAFDKEGNAIIEDPSAFLTLSMTYAHTLINNRGRSSGIEEERLPRTTCVACLVQNGYAYWGHVGDSRLYLFSDGALLTRTVDHTTSDQMHQDGVIDEEVQRLGHSQLFRCVGGVKSPVVSLGPETHLGTGDTLLLCTDGIWRAFAETQLAKLTRGGSLEESLEEMFSRAQKFFHRDCDNLTALLFRWNAAPSLHKPLLNSVAAELGHEGLMRAARKPAARGDNPARTEIESAIREIESFVDQLDEKYHNPPRDSRSDIEK